MNGRDGQNVVGGRDPGAELPVDLLERGDGPGDLRSLDGVEGDPADQAVERPPAAHNIADAIELRVADQDRPLLMQEVKTTVSESRDADVDTGFPSRPHPQLGLNVGFCGRALRLAVLTAHLMPLNRCRCDGTNATIQHQPYGETPRFNINPYGEETRRAVLRAG